ncbi:c-type cytochrome [Bdellovibrio sp. HCB337]|uniref:c-type cytochrome n=1 Tax=Bdellovibrio sp. HCB337 TaxID=3394358 RepID=UPI0039A5CD9B
MKKTGLILLILIASVLVLNFQNCGGGMAPLEGVVEQQSIVDIDASSIPRLLSSSSYVYRKTQNTETVNKTPALSETASAVLVFDRAATGTIYRFYASANTDEARISLETNGMIRIWHISTGSHYAYADVPLPDASAGNQVTVAASFGLATSSMKLLVNGMKQNLTLQKVGSPYDFSYVQKTVVLGALTGGTLWDVATFSQSISGLDLNVMSRSMANALQVYNVAFDSSLINDTGDDGGVSGDSPEFLAAKAVIDNNCLGCHNSSNNGDFRNLTQSQYISKGLVVAKNPGASKIYYRLTGAAAGPGPANMPQGAAALSAADVAAVAAWINGL